MKDNRTKNKKVPLYDPIMTSFPPKICQMKLTNRNRFNTKMLMLIFKYE